MAAQYTAYIKDLVDYNGNIIYPRTKAEAIYDNDGNVLSIPKNFIINVTVDSEGLGYTADKTYAEILEAYNMGHTLYVDYSLVRLTLMSVSDGRFVFIQNTGEMIVMASISESDIGVVVEYLEPVPRATPSSDVGKVLMIDNDGYAAWTAITNAEEVEY